MQRYGSASVGSNTADKLAYGGELPFGLLTGMTGGGGRLSGLLSLAATMPRNAFQRDLGAALLNPSRGAQAFQPPAQGLLGSPMLSGRALPLLPGQWRNE